MKFHWDRPRIAGTLKFCAKCWSPYHDTKDCTVFRAVSWPFVSFLMFLGVFTWGCSTMRYDHGVPNLVSVAPGVWRSGQPLEGAWSYLHGLGVRKVVKLNYDDETGYDEVAVAKAAGIEVIKIQIPPSENVVTVFEPVDPTKVEQAINIIRTGGGVLWHCTHGQDRTGLVGGVADVVVFRKTKSEAWHDMIAHGFHFELPNLMDFWLDFELTGNHIKLVPKK